MENTNGAITRRRILRYIIQVKQNRDGLSPTYREICEAVKLSSTSAVAHQLHILEHEGKITIGEGKRSIQVTGGRWVYEGPKV